MKLMKRNSLPFLIIKLLKVLYELWKRWRKK